jgi:DNA ligase (NAD+)
VCQGNVELRSSERTETLHCINPNCSAKLSQTIKHFCSKKAMDITDCSIKTIEKFIEKGFIKDITDIFKIEQYRKEIIHMDGFGLKSYNNLIKSVNNSKQTTLAKFIYSLGINNVGSGSAKDLQNRFKTIETFKNCTFNELISMNDMGEITSNSIINYLNDKNNQNLLNKLLHYIEFEEETKVESKSSVSLEGKIFVITGKVELYKNRDELKAVIESLGGKVGSSVSAKTNYLLTDDTESGTGKNKMAKQLNIPIINEVQFQEMIK